MRLVKRTVVLSVLAVFVVFAISLLLVTPRHWWTVEGTMAASAQLKTYFKNKATVAEKSPEPSNTFQARREHVQQVCRRHPLAYNMTKDVSRYFSFSVRHRLVYCSIQKVGCSFWQRIMKILTGDKPGGSLLQDSLRHLAGIKGDNAFSGKRRSQQERILRSFKKFMFVRDPYARLFSGYMDKVFIPTNRMFDVLRRAGLKDAMMKVTPKNKLECLTNVSFRTFLEAVTSGQLGDPHYSPMYKHCDPCRVDFNFIGKMETFMEDAEYILSQVGVAWTDLNSNVSASFRTQNDLVVIADLAKDATRFRIHKNCPPTYLCDVFLRVWVTLQTRGLISIKVPFPLPSSHCENTSLGDFLLLLKKAYFESSNLQERIGQRQTAMMEAYFSLPRTLLVRVEGFVQKDCDLFGYECSVDVRFPVSDSRHRRYKSFAFSSRFWH